MNKQWGQCCSLESIGESRCQQKTVCFLEKDSEETIQEWGNQFRSKEPGVVLLNKLAEPISKARLRASFPKATGGGTFTATTRENKFPWPTMRTFENEAVWLWAPSHFG